MTRMGHSTARAALVHQHMTADRDCAIADRLGSMIRQRQGGAETWAVFFERSPSFVMIFAWGGEI